jgi:carbon storage regulator
MLVLSRRIGEKILIGEDIVLEVTDVSRGRVRIGIVAPKSVRIVRGELSENDCPRELSTHVNFGRNLSGFGGGEIPDAISGELSEDICLGKL